MCLVGTVVWGLSFVEPTPGVMALFQRICIDNYCCVYGGTSISIDRYVQGTGELGGDAGFLRNVAG